MANQHYGAAPPPSYIAATTKSFIGSYFSDSALLRYLGVLSESESSHSPALSMYLTQAEALRYSADRGIASAAATASHFSSFTPPPGVDVEPLLAGIKRSSEVGQTEAWYSTNIFSKRSRFENPSNLPVYPQRPGEKDCAHYMQTRTCKFGDSCKFDHPIWVPEGGIPEWKEVPPVTAIESLPDRPGEPDCPYFLKTQRCKYGSKCKFNHPKYNLAPVGSENSGVFVLPERPSEPTCAFYMKTGNCKFGATCKFHHPKDIQISLGQENGDAWQKEIAIRADGSLEDVNAVNMSISFTPASYHNTKGLPMRPGEADCPFYLKTGSCKYGPTCRYNHPDRNAFTPAAAAVGHPILANHLANLGVGFVNPAASIYQSIDPRLAQATLGVGLTIYPQRYGQAECDFYMKTGECKYGERCRFHHPLDRSAPSAKQVEQQIVKLTLAGLPRREGAVHCPYYMKTGSCKYGANCKFDHPTPGEVMAVQASQEEC
ncbi:zinc finger CCCH domain-containing protein 37 isoform X2 [Euphorbia lathyris]|uniref:zinc finger CCCH domain-containing protein 37 isoform X2 n=1 Tax=Euphorbia lathyris TaxID=212925 RepID=UPI003313D270